MRTTERLAKPSKAAASVPAGHNISPNSPVVDSEALKGLKAARVNMGDVVENIHDLAQPGELQKLVQEGWTPPKQDAQGNTSTQMGSLLGLYGNGQRVNVNADGSYDLETFFETKKDAEQYVDTITLGKDGTVQQSGTNIP